MPFIDGETLRARLDRETQLGVDESVRIACDVADALHHAHSNGVVHRDIKPENILLANGRPMVADFGIALAVSAAAGGRMTETGLSLGTPHYMSPEQATAEKEISARSDIYSLASVLYEMLAGQPPHLGGSAQQIIMKIITEQPAPVTQYRKAVPSHVAAALAQALEKLPADRFASAKAFAEALANPAFTFRTHPAGGYDRQRGWNRATTGMAVLAAALAVLLLVSMGSRSAQPAAERQVVRFALADDASLRIDAGSTRPFAVSPDGSTIVFRASTATTPVQLWVRTIGDTRARPLDGTANGVNPAISPDGQWVAFMVASRELRKVPINGGDVVRIATLASVTAALSWSSNDEIYLEQIGPDDAIQRVNANGGRVETAIPFDTAAGETRQRRPLVLRDHGLVVYGSSTPDLDEATLVLYRIADGRRVRLGIPGIGPLAFLDGHLVYSRADGTLTAVPLDVRGMRIAGTPVPLTPRVAALTTGTAAGLSEGGTLVYGAARGAAAARLDLVDSTGLVMRRIPGEFAVTEPPRFSPDGRRILLSFGSESGQAGRGAALRMYVSDLWVVDVVSGEPQRVTSDNVAAAPSWTADGRRALYSRAVDGGFELWSIPVDGTAPASRLVQLDGIPVASAMVPGDSSVIVQARRSRNSSGVALIRAWLDGSARTDTLLAWHGEGVRPGDPRVSPDGQWVAYTDRTTSDVWVRSLTGTSAMQVSAISSEDNPVVWGADSRQLFYATSQGLVAIELQTSPTLGVGRRRVIPGFPHDRDYDIAPDGRTFVIVTPVRSTSDIFVTVNWADEARRAWRDAVEKKQ
jgi:eukaryotic-like serine/threonine-protein kinase